MLCDATKWGIRFSVRSGLYSVRSDSTQCRYYAKRLQTEYQLLPAGSMITPNCPFVYFVFSNINE